MQGTPSCDQSAMSSVDSYPFAQEFITDAQGQIRKVILDIADYQKLIEALEDEGLYQAINAVRHETPSPAQAINPIVKSPRIHIQKVEVKQRCFSSSTSFP